MFSWCMGSDQKSCCDTFDVKIENTKTGIKINVDTKDKSKIESLQKCVESCKDMCNCNC